MHTHRDQELSHQFSSRKMNTTSWVFFLTQMGGDGTEKRKGFKINSRKISASYCNFVLIWMLLRVLFFIKPSSVTSNRNFLKLMEFCTVTIIKCKKKYLGVFLTADLQMEARL
jgi:hypothetical protein